MKPALTVVNLGFFIKKNLKKIPRFFKRKKSGLDIRIFLALTFIFGLMQATVMHYFRFFGTKPDFFIISVVIASLFYEPRRSLLLVIFAGLLKDSLSVSYFGMHTVLFIILSVLIIRLSKIITVDNDIVRSVLVLLSALLNNIMARVVFLFSGRVLTWQISLKVIILEAFYTAAVAYFAFRLIKLDRYQ
ncbi:MAG: rod shape-determining protein MreD [Candidatus Omnitrophica bacterium]|nr:rod shape-determining protein MreD [Candidatus Omnitrophota bacterium]